MWRQSSEQIKKQLSGSPSRLCSQDRPGCGGQTRRGLIKVSCHSPACVCLPIRFSASGMLVCYLDVWELGDGQEWMYFKRSSWFICHLLNKGGDFFMTRKVQPLSSAFTTMQLCCIHLHGYQWVIYIIQLRRNDFWKKKAKYRLINQLTASISAIKK